MQSMLLNVRKYDSQKKSGSATARHAGDYDSDIMDGGFFSSFWDSSVYDDHLINPVAEWVLAEAGAPNAAEDSPCGVRRDIKASQYRVSQHNGEENTSALAEAEHRLLAQGCQSVHVEAGEKSLDRRPLSASRGQIKRPISVREPPLKASLHGHYFFIVPNGTTLIIFDMRSSLPILWLAHDGTEDIHIAAAGADDQLIIDFDLVFTGAFEVTVAILTSDGCRAKGNLKLYRIDLYQRTRQLTFDWLFDTASTVATIHHPDVALKCAGEVITIEGVQLFDSRRAQIIWRAAEVITFAA